MEKFKKLLSAFLKSNKYDNIIQLGYNCEGAYRFYRNYKFVDSSLFGWSFVTFEQLKYALLNFKDIAEDDFVFNKNDYMFSCTKTGVSFHGRTPASSYTDDQNINNNIIEEDKQELHSRIKYLKEKFIKTSKDGKKNLYIKKISRKEAEQENFRDEIMWLHNYLKDFCKNEFKLLLITEKDFYDKFIFDNPQILTRYVEKYSPDETVTDKKAGDAFGWKLIYTEFRPAHRKKHKGKLKFEEV